MIFQEAAWRLARDPFDQRAGPSRGQSRGRNRHLEGRPERGLEGGLEGGPEGGLEEIGWKKLSSERTFRFLEEF